ncbi:uroporphyrinogen-III C-methyltransferase [Paenibacillus albicereus]|uniref:Uroporphyrinogen-III C-methyltransferase n=1 Tax=Paenibacillus albicereus TaxID=2726185 RepID=A0A6H2H243_9BACL|nr:uroporphyrinogen-III C-methyltransferase [Paenibacillus albicereus]QJC53669.1 uroporphyrinogen-III C-methyltransferase [Paenibacillus albicereus]
MKPGLVSIVGAGPGDPELIAVKALRRLQQADVILYDRLVSPQLLEEASPSSRRIYCGKAPGRHAMSQEQINALLVRFASQGLAVVRLKGGDPLVFGRGGEEALELARHGIPWELVPGLTSASGAAAAEGIPLTHRGISASFACVSGTRASAESPEPRWDLLAHGVDTLVVYMGISRLEAIAAELLRHGKPAGTPAAIVERATTPGSRTLVGTLAGLPSLAASAGAASPALIVIGEVVLLRERLQALSAQLESTAG